MARCPEFRAVRSVDHAQQKCGLPAFEFSEATEIRGGDVVIDLAEISVIGEIEYVEAETDLARTEVKPGRDAKVPVDLGIEGKKHWKSLGVGQPNVILTLIYFGIRIARVYVHDRAEHQIERNMEGAPSDHAVRHIRRANTVGVGPDHRLLERNEDVPERVQISPGPAPDVGDIQVAILNGMEPQGCFRLAVVFLPRVKKAENACRAPIAAKRRNDKQVARHGVHIAEAQNGSAPKRAVHFCAGNKTASAGVRRMTDSRGYGVTSVRYVLVLESNRISDRLTICIELTDDACRIPGKNRREQRNAVIENARSGTENGLAIFARRIRDAEAWREGRCAAHGLAGESSAEVRGQAIAEHPVVRDKLFHIRYGSAKRSRAGELYLFGETAVFAEQADRL